MGKPLVPAGERFSPEQVCRMLAISERQLTAWERQGLVQPSRQGTENGERGTGNREQGRSRRAKQAGSGDRQFTFSDLITLKTLLQLRQNGVPVARLRMAHAALKAKLAEVEKPWSELQIKGSGKKLTVQFQGATMEAITGQLLLDYGRRDQRDGEATLRPFQRSANPRKRSPAEKKAIAERFFMAGLRYEAGEGLTKKAIHAYQRAIEMNPEAVGAFINLGTIYYNLEQLEAAESCYQAALSVDPGYALVHFNLGNVFDEQKEFEKARQHYEEAIRCDPTYPDPRYNLALVCEKLGLHGKARQQWLRYLKMDPDSEWGSYARQQLEKTPLRLVPGAPAGAARVGVPIQGAPADAAPKHLSLQPGKNAKDAR